MGDRAAARPDRMNVDDRKADREIPDRVFVRPADIPVDQGDIGRRAAHVEADEFGKSGGPGQLERADDAPGRAGESGPDGLLPGFPGGDVALVGLHDKQGGLVQPSFQRFQVPVQDGHQEGVDRGRRRALVFAVFRKQARGDANEKAAPLELGGDRLLVCPVGVSVDEGDGRGLDASADERPGEGSDGGRRGGPFDGSVGGRPLGDPEAQVPLDEGNPRLAFQAVKKAAGLAADREDVLESLRRDESDLGAFPLEKGVGGHRRSVDEDEARPGLEVFPQTLQDGPGGIVRRRGELFRRRPFSLMTKSVKVPPVSTPIRTILISMASAAGASLAGGTAGGFLQPARSAADPEAGDELPDVGAPAGSADHLGFPAEADEGFKPFPALLALKLIQRHNGNILPFSGASVQDQDPVFL